MMTGQHRRHRAASTVRVVATAVLVLIVWMQPASAEVDVETVAAYQLLSTLTAHLLTDGSMELRIVDGEAPLLTVEWPRADDRRRTEESSCHFTFTEGAPGGLRGFARAADDDNDGSIDEDPADGRDNDGDGAVDEDFAAIGDLMGVVEISCSGRTLHLETYHWTYAHLHSTVFLSGHCYEMSGSTVDGVVRLAAVSGTWSRTMLHWSTAGRGGDRREREQAFVASVPSPATPGGRIWIGLSLLGGPAAGSSHEHHPRFSGSLLEVPLGCGQVEMAITAAPTFLQLKANLEAGHAVYRGAKGSEERGRIRWIVPPLCQICRNAITPDIRRRPSAGGALDLVVSLKAGDNGWIDPDRFRLDDMPLGSPARIIWEPENAIGGFEKNWGEVHRQDTDGWIESDLDPYAAWSEVKNHTAAGCLVFSFTDPAPAPSSGEEPPQLTGGWLTGREFSLPLEGEPATTAVLREIRSGRPPSLASELLMNYPNPFRNQTRMQVKVPQTIGEGLVWEKGESPLLDPESEMPWAGGQPSASLKIYSVSGHEILTIFSGILAPGGQYEYSWNGEDVFGRPVASGTYFCKLQLEDWSVTKQVVYLR